MWYGEGEAGLRHLLCCCVRHINGKMHTLCVADTCWLICRHEAHLSIPTFTKTHHYTNTHTQSSVLTSFKGCEVVAWFLWIAATVSNVLFRRLAFFSLGWSKNWVSQTHSYITLGMHPLRFSLQFQFWDHNLCYLLIWNTDQYPLYTLFKIFIKGSHCMDLIGITFALKAELAACHDWKTKHWIL